MKIVKGFSVFVFLTVLMGSCFDQPEYSVIPEIEFQKLEFVQASDFTGTDSLILDLNFKDGDGDLGVAEKQVEQPFNSVFYFLENGAGELTKIGTDPRYTNLDPFVNTGGASGMLATIRTRKKPGYESLPAYVSPYSCTHYIYTKVYVSQEDAAIFDDTYNLDSTLQGGPGFPNVYILEDTFYYERNPLHYNLEIDWLVKNSQGGYDEFDWTSLNCSTGFDGRFPVLTDRTRPVEGTIRYDMQSTGFLQLFSIKTLKLRIFVRDRALNKSNVIETGDFTLNDIRK